MLTLHINGLHGKKKLYPCLKGKSPCEQRTKTLILRNTDATTTGRPSLQRTASAYRHPQTTLMLRGTVADQSRHMQPMGQIGHSWGASSPNMSIET
jgi:hypothetical protein